MKMDKLILVLMFEANYWEFMSVALSSNPITDSGFCFWEESSFSLARYVRLITILTFPLLSSHLSPLLFSLPSSRSRKFLLCLLTQDLLEGGTFHRMWFSAG